MLHLPRTQYLLIVVLFLAGWTSAQSLTRPGDYFQQEVACRIDVTLNDKDHTQWIDAAKVYLARPLPPGADNLPGEVKTLRRT